jgi:hypothetical protein
VGLFFQGSKVAHNTFCRAFAIVSLANPHVY